MVSVVSGPFQRFGIVTFKGEYKNLSLLLTKVIIGTFLLNSCLFSQTQVIFTAPSRVLTKAIFPSDVFTSPAATATGVQIQFKNDEKDCLQTGQAVCSNADLLNRLDGFSVNPRISVCFSGEVDWAKAEDGISFVRASDPASAPIGLKQVIHDSNSHCLYAKPERILDQRTQYLLLIRNTVTDSGGQSVVEDSRFQACLASGQPYCAKLAAALNQSAIQRESVVGASLFTTLDATGWLEGAYQYVNRTQPPLTLPAGFPWQFPTAFLKSITWNPENSKLPPQNIPVQQVLEGVGSIAFGLFPSPNYINTSGPDVGTITNSPDQPVAVPQLVGGLTFGYVPVSFHVFLPNKPAPPGGYPAVIYGHGLGDSQYGAPTYMASTLAKAGYATIAIEILGHGYGAGSTVTVRDKFGLTYKMLAPGRGVQIMPGEPIGPADGCFAPGAIATRDCGRQTAVDLFAFIKTIQRTNGLGLGLNPQAISYFGQSFGSIAGTLMHAVAPDIQSAVFDVGGGPFVDVARLSVTGRPVAVQYLCGLGLLNVHTRAETCPAGHNLAANAKPQDYFKDEFNDSYPYRDSAVVTAPEPGALSIQAAFEAAEWLGMLGDVLSYAPHMKSAPLSGVQAKNFLLLNSDGDMEVPNPTNTAFSRAAGADGQTIRFLFPNALGPAPEYQALAGVMDPAIPDPLPILPHRITSNPTVFTPEFPNQLEKAIALAKQTAVADFFKSGGSVIPNANLYLDTEGNPYFGRRDLFETTTYLPPGLNFIQVQP